MRDGCNKKHFCIRIHHLLDSLVVECGLQVQEVQGLILSQGLRHTKDVIKMVPVIPLFSTDDLKGNTGSFSRIKLERKSNG